MELYPTSYVEPRDSVKPEKKNLLYLRSTTTNYNIYTNPSLDISTNLLLMTETFKNLTSANYFILTSSWFCYGKNNIEYCKESDATNPLGFYSISKLAQEKFLQSYCTTFNIPYLILRLSNIIGGDPRADGKKNALEFFLKKIKRGEDISIYEGDHYRSFMHVKDCCRAIKMVIDYGNPNEIYNVGSSESYKMSDIMEYAINKLNSKSKISRIPISELHKQIQPMSFRMNCDKLYSLGFAPEYSFWQTIDEILNA